MTHLIVEQHTISNISDILCPATYVGQGLECAKVGGVHTAHPTHDMLSLPANIHSVSNVIK